MLIQRLHDGVNHVRKTITANFICVELAFVGADYSLLADFTRGQAAQSGDGIIKSCSMAFEHIVPDSPGFFSEDVYLGVKVIPALHVIGTFCPRAKSAHEASKIAYTSFSGVLVRMFPGSIVASDLQNVETVSSREGRKARDNQARVFSVRHVWMIFSGLLGWISYGAFREWRLTRKDRSLKLPESSWPNTVKLPYRSRPNTLKSR
jgi:hypothetical protein